MSLELNSLYNVVQRITDNLKTGHKDISLQLLRMFLYIAKTGDSGCQTSDLIRLLKTNQVQIHRNIEALKDYVTYVEYPSDRKGPTPRTYKLNKMGKYILNIILQGENLNGL